MKKILFNIIILLSIFFCAYVWAADEISIHARVDKPKAYKDSQIIYSITVSGNIKEAGELELPSFENFKAYSAGVSKSISIINGQMSASDIYSYILRPDAPGTYEIGSSKISYKGKTYESESLNIEVTDQPSPVAQEQSIDDTEEQSDDQSCYVDLKTNKDEAYVNEQIILTFKFYFATRLLSQPQYQEPTYNGFWKEDLPSIAPYTETINGKKYMVRELNYALFPISSGELTISPATLMCEVPSQSAKKRHSMFDFGGFDFFSMGIQGEPRTLKTKSILIKVKPLPAQIQPKNFSGAVGQFDIKALLDKNKTKQGEAVNLKVELTGQGNFNSVKKIDSLKDVLEGFNVYMPDEPKTEIFRDGKIIRGKNTFDIVLVPNKYGKFTIPAIPFCYFDPEKGMYTTASTQPLELEVLESKDYKEEPQIIDYSSKEKIINKEDIQLLKDDVRHLKPDLGQIYSVSGQFSILFLVAFLLGPLIIFIQLFFYFKKQKFSQDQDKIRQKQAYKKSQHGFHQAGQLFKKPHEFYEGLSVTMQQYLADKFNVSISSLTSTEIEKNLTEQGIKADVIKKIIEILSHADYLRYAAGAGDTKEEMNKKLEAAKDVIKELEKNLK